MAAKKTAETNVVHSVRRPGNLVAEYIKGEDGTVERKVRRLTDAELEAEETGK